MFDSQITQLDQSQLDSIFDKVPATEVVTIENPVQPVEQATPIVTTIADEKVINLSDDQLNDIFDKKEPIVEDKKVEPIEDKKVEEEKDVKKNEESINEPVEAKEVLKNTVDYLITSGIWQDFEGRENLEITQEVYAQLASEQNRFQVEQMFSELVDETGDYGKAIITHIKSGGNPDEIIDLFKEQKQIEQIDTSTEQGKQSKIEKYYKDVLGWKEEKVNKTIKRLIEDNEVDSEFNDVSELYDKHYEERLNEIKERDKQLEVQKQDAQKRFISSIKTALSENESIPEKEKTLIAKSILDFNHKLENGQKVNDFYLKFAQMQADPKQYIELVRFVMNPEGFKNQIQAKSDTKAAKEVFSFIKGNATVSKPSNSDITIDDKKSKQFSDKGTNFSFAIRK